MMTSGETKLQKEIDELKKQNKKQEREIHKLKWNDLSKNYIYQIEALKKENVKLKEDNEKWKKDAIGFRVNHNRLINLIKGCDTTQKFKMLKDLGKVEQK